MKDNGYVSTLLLLGVIFSFIIPIRGTFLQKPQTFRPQMSGWDCSTRVSKQILESLVHVVVERKWLHRITRISVQRPLLSSWINHKPELQVTTSSRFVPPVHRIGQPQEAQFSEVYARWEPMWHVGTPLSLRWPLLKQTLWAYPKVPHGSARRGLSRYYYYYIHE